MLRRPYSNDVDAKARWCILGNDDTLLGSAFKAILSIIDLLDFDTEFMYLKATRVPPVTGFARLQTVTSVNMDVIPEEQGAHSALTHLDVASEDGSASAGVATGHGTDDIGLDTTQQAASVPLLAHSPCSGFRNIGFCVNRCAGYVDQVRCHCLGDLGTPLVVADTTARHDHNLSGTLAVAQNPL